MTPDFDARITFHDDLQVMEADFSNFDFASPALVNAFYDRIETRIRETGEDKWFFLVNYSHCRIDSSAWVAFSRRGKALNMAHSMGSVRFDVSDATRKQIERDAETERFDPNLFADRDSALARVKTFKSVRREKIVHTPSHTPEEIARRITFDPDGPIMEADFSYFTFAHSRDVDDVYDAIKRLYADEETVAVTKSATAADASVASSTCAGELQLQIRAANALAMHQTVAVK